MNKKITIFSLFLIILATQNILSMNQEERPRKKLKVDEISLSQNQNSPLLSLPDEIKNLIAKYLTWKDIGNLRRTCKNSTSSFIPPQKLIVLRGNVTSLKNKLRQISAQKLFENCPISLDPWEGYNDLQNLLADIIQMKISHRIIKFKYHTPEQNPDDFLRLPPEINQLQELKELRLFYWDCLTLREEVKKICSLQQLEKLTLHQYEATITTNFSELPSEINQLQRLKSLKIKEHNLTSQEIAKICSLHQLEKLGFVQNDLSQLPPEITQLQRLKKLNLSHSRLDTQEIVKVCSLSNLKELHLVNNGLKDLPHEITHLQMLKKLKLDRNFLSNEQEIKKICSLYQLEKLGFVQNDISQLPPEINQLQKLKELDLSDNYFNQKMRVKTQRLLPNTKINF